MDMLDLTQTLVGQTVVLEYNRIVFDTRLNRIGNCLGLLHDLLEHKVLVSALFRCGHIPRYGHDFLLYRIAELVHDNYAVRANDCNLVIIQNNVTLGAIDNSGNIGCDHVLALTDTDNQRVAAACSNDLLRVIHRDYAQCVRAAQTLHGLQNGLGQILLLAGVQIVHEVRDSLRIGLGLKLVAVCLQTLTQLLVVLDNAVVYNCYLALAAQMRVGVAVGRLAVRCPAGVADTAGAVHVAAFFLDLLLKVCNAAARLDNAQTVLREGSHTGRVIATVFQAVQTLDENRKRILASGESNDSTHKIILLCNGKYNISSATFQYEP